MEHIIQKQTFKISAPTLRMMQDWEGRAQGILNDVINPAIDRCFTEVSSTDEVRIVDILEIDLGLLTKMTNGEIISKVMSLLSSQLRENGKSYKTYAKASENNVINSANRDAEAYYQALSKQETAVACFVYFLVHGRLPWWVQPDTVQLHGDWVEHLSPQQRSIIFQELETHRHAVERLIFQFSAEFIASLLKHSNDVLVASVSACWRGLDKICLASHRKPARLYYEFWNYWVRQCLGHDGDQTPLIQTVSQWTTDISEVRRYLAFLLTPEGRHDSDPDIDLSNEERQSLNERFKDVLKIALAGQRQPRDGYENLKHSQETVKEKSNRVQPTDITNTSMATPSPSPVEHDLTNAIETTVDVPGTRDTKNIEGYERIKTVYPNEAIDQLYVETAGLVVVHPFLTELFTTEGLWSISGWTSGAAQHQAVALTSWLAFGEAEIPEYKMIIPKLLCGMPCEKPLDTSVPLTESNLRCGAELLEAIIQHWKVLGKASIDGLREGFIMREGKLTMRDDGWQLIIEKKAQDILVSKLPWSLSVIRLPWFGNKNIFVDWT